MPRKRKSKKMVVARMVSAKKWMDWRTSSDRVISENERIAFYTGFNMGYKSRKQSELPEVMEE